MHSMYSRCARILGSICLITVIPLFMIANFDFPSADDFFYLWPNFAGLAADRFGYCGVTGSFTADRAAIFRMAG